MELDGGGAGGEGVGGDDGNASGCGGLLVRHLICFVQCLYNWPQQGLEPPQLRGAVPVLASFNKSTQTNTTLVRFS